MKRQRNLLEYLPESFRHVVLQFRFQQVSKDPLNVSQDLYVVFVAFAGGVLRRDIRIAGRLLQSGVGGRWERLIVLEEQFRVGEGIELNERMPLKGERE